MPSYSSDYKHQVHDHAYEIDRTNPPACRRFTLLLKSSPLALHGQPTRNSCANPGGQMTYDSMGPADVPAHRGHARPAQRSSTVKEKIHPRYMTCTVHCACGNTF